MDLTKISYINELIYIVLACKSRLESEASVLSTIPYMLSVSSCNSKALIGMQQRTPRAAKGIMVSQTVLIEWANACRKVSRTCLGKVSMIEMSENERLEASGPSVVEF